MEPKSVDQIFWDASQITSTGERSAYVNRACGNDTGLREKIERLLLAKSKAEDFLESPGLNWDGTIDEPITERPGMFLGNYKLLEQIGEGGFGVVFMAEQQHPIRRKVALKVIKPGMDTRQVVARFEAERQALALMDHPNIAHVYDGGATTSGRPYFVMELVRGIPVTEFCDQKHLGVRERLELFVSVCHAVQHAHQKGIIHRDLKPTNVLVTMHDSKPVAKVIDFGIAKATGQQLTEKTLFTNFAQMIGTPLYMSPEQAQLSGLDVDTRSDIYSLGVLLYELLTGTTPFDKERLRTAAYDEIRRIIREEEPAKPSTRMSTLAMAGDTMTADRRSDAKRLSRLFKGELDWIVMKALEKDRERRYETASAFAADVERYLHDEQVLACPPSAWYRFRKFARRNKAALAIASIVASGVLLATVGLFVNNRLVTREKEQTASALEHVVAEKQRANENLAKARAAVKEYLLKTAESPQLRAADFHDLRRELLETAIPFYLQFVQQSQDDPDLEAERGLAYYDLGLLRWEMGDEKRALEDLAEAEGIDRRLTAAFPEKLDFRRRLAEALNTRAGILHALGRPNEAGPAYHEAFEILDAMAAAQPAVADYRDSLARTCSSRGEFLRALSQPREAEALFRRAITLREALTKEKPADRALRGQLAMTWVNLGVAILAQRRPDDAEKAYLTAADLLNPEAPGMQGATADVVARCEQIRSHAFNNLAVVRRETGRFADAAEAIRTAISIKERLAERFPSVPQYRQELAGGYSTLGTVLSDLNRPGDARTAYDKSIQISERLVADFRSVPAYATTLAGTYVNLGRLVGDNGDLEPSLLWLTKSIEMLKPYQQRDPRVVKVSEALRTAHWARAMTLSGLDRQELAIKDWSRAIELDDGRYAIMLRMRRASSYLNLKDHASATSDAMWVAESSNASAHDVYQAACAHSLASRQTGEDAGLAEQYATTAVNLLQQAKNKGFEEHGRWKDDPDLEPLRGREDFRKLLDELNPKANKHNADEPASN